jgi:hypothetical protein
VGKKELEENKARDEFFSSSSVNTDLSIRRSTRNSNFDLQNTSKQFLSTNFSPQTKKAPAVLNSYQFSVLNFKFLLFGTTSAGEPKIPLKLYYFFLSFYIRNKFKYHCRTLKNEPPYDHFFSFYLLPRV